MNWIRINDRIRRLSRATSIAGYVFLVFGSYIAVALWAPELNPRWESRLLMASRELAGFALLAGVVLATISATLTAFLPKHELLPLTGFVVADCLLLPYALLAPVVT